MSDDLTREEVYETVDRFVMDLLESAGVVEAPVDAIALAGHLGLAIDPDAPTSRRNGPPRPSPLEASAERRQWAVAHAIGEQLKPQLLRRLGIDPDQTRGLLGESLANLIASRILVPTPWLADEASQVDFDLPTLEQRFRTASHEVIAWRWLDLSIPCIVTIIDNDHISRRRGNTIRAPRELSRPEKRCHQAVQRYSRPHEVNEEGWRVQGWPIHDVDWKREILRSQVDEPEREA